MDGWNKKISLLIQKRLLLVTYVAYYFEYRAHANPCAYIAHHAFNFVFFHLDGEISVQAGGETRAETHLCLSSISPLDPRRLWW